MSLAPLLTNNGLANLFSLSGSGGGGGGGGGSTITTQVLTVSSINGSGGANDTVDIGTKFVTFTNPDAINDAVTIYANPVSGGSADPAFISTVGLRFDIAGTISRIIQEAGQPLVIQGVNGVSISSINISSINGQPVGGGGGLTNSNVEVSTSFVCAGATSAPICAFSTTSGNLYKCSFLIEGVSTFASIPAPEERISVVDPTASVVYTETISNWSTVMGENPKGTSVEFTFKALGTGSLVYMYQNTTAGSTLVTLSPNGLWLTDFGAT